MSDEFGTSNSAGFEPSSAGSVGTTSDAGSVGSQGSVGDQGSQASTPVTLTDDTLVSIPGQTTPVKWGELTARQQAEAKRQQADYTRKTQGLAAERTKWQQEQAQQRQHLEQLAAKLAGVQRGTQTNPLDAVKDLPYIDGATFHSLMTQMQTDGFGSVAKAFQERDVVLKHFIGEVSRLSKVVESLNGTNAEQGFNAKISNWVRELGLPEKATNLAKEIYMAYEGDDLDNEFPQILRTRWEEIVQLARSQDQARVNEAKTKFGKGKFPFAGKGGNATAGKPIGLKGNESSRVTADFLWDAIQAANEGNQT